MSDATGDDRRSRFSAWSLLPVQQMLAKRLAGKSPQSLESVAEKTWVIAPEETVACRPAIYLPHQLDRVTGWLFSSSEHPRSEIEAATAIHGATRGFLLKDAWLIDGTLYKGGASQYLSPRAGILPRIRAEHEFGRGAMYCSVGGNRYFGQWLIDDCCTYSLVGDEGVPITIDRPVYGHVQAYMDLLGMKPTQVGSAYFRELVIFDDVAHNHNKGLRFQAMRNRIRSGVDAPQHPGVFILRGAAGERRVLRNEIEIAELLRDRRGFRILDPLAADVPTILKSCAGARVVVGVEGSALSHGVAAMPAGAALLTLQPPNRFVSVFRARTEWSDQHFGFVVGFPDGEDFRIDPQEVERTLDLFPS